jgi:heterodisulfide reductase subunit B
MATSTDINTDTKQHLSDMVALDEHILEAVKHQLGVDKVKEDADALALLTRTQDIYARHIEQMKTMVELQDAETRTSLKSILTSFLGDIAGLYNPMRTDGAARAIRDTYTALNLTSASLTALKTFGLIVGKEPISNLSCSVHLPLFRAKGSST